MPPSTAVRLATPAGNTSTTIKIGNKRNGLSLLEAFRITRVHQLSRQLMTQDAGIREERLRAFESVQVRTTDTNAPDTDDRLSRSRLGLFYFFVFELTRIDTH
jgi:hypothetical protein